MRSHTCVALNGGEQWDSCPLSSIYGIFYGY